jgi:hypothetical protein
LQLPIPIDGEIKLQKLRSPFNSDLLKGNFVQLVIYDFKKIPMEDKVGKMIKVTGTLFESHTGHHHTPVLMSVEKAELIDSYRW